LHKTYEWFGELLGYSNGAFQFLWNAGATSADIQVTSDSALKTIAVQRCVSLISGALAMSPIYAYERGTRRKGVSSPLEALLNIRPNPEMTGFQFRAFSVQQMLLWGASYSMIVRRGRNGQPIALWPLPASQMTRKRTDAGSVYYERMVNGQITVIPGEEVLYVPYIITNAEGDGLSVIQAHAEAIGANQAAEKHSALWFKNGARMSGLLQTPNKLTDEAYRRLRESWAETYGGVEAAHKPAILEQGLTFSPMSLKPQDSQLLETRVYNDEQVAMLFGVPPSMIGLTAKSTSWGTGIAEQVLGWQKFTVGPLGTQYEQRAHLQLSGEAEIELRHDYSELLKMDFKSLVDALKNAVQGGILTPNEARAAVEYDPKPGADELLVQQQMIPVSKAGSQLTNGGSDAALPTV
jgi:HK97 family phage portal protein